ARHAQSAIDAGVVVLRHAGNVARLHEGDQLVASDVEEDVAQRAAFLDAQGVFDDRLEAQHVLVEGARLVEVEGREADMGEALVGHEDLLAWLQGTLFCLSICASVRLLSRRRHPTPGCRIPAFVQPSGVGPTETVIGGYAVPRMQKWTEAPAISAASSCGVGVQGVVMQGVPGPFTVQCTSSSRTGRPS